MRLTPFIPCCLLIVASACGDDEKDDKSSGGGGTGMVNSGVDGAKPLNMITDAEAQQIAQSYASASSTDELLDGVCKFSAVLSTSISADPEAGPTAEQIQACNDAYAMCQMQISQAQAQPAAPPTGGMSVPSSATAFADCGITVEQYEACLTASIALLEQLYSGLSCDQPAMFDMTAPTTSAAECEAFQQCSAAAATEG